MRTTESRAKRAINRIRRVWSELDYAERRLFEIRTGIPSTRREHRSGISSTVDELNRLYAA